MGRRLTFLAYALVVFIAGKSVALGLGEIELDSALNQNFSATIPVTGSGGLTDYEVLVSLANADDFKRVGVERFFYLTNIRFVITANVTNPCSIIGRVPCAVGVLVPLDSRPDK